MSFWNLILLPAGAEAGISVRELEINTSTPLVCSAQLALPVSVLLHSSPPTEGLPGELEFSASMSFSKIRFVISHNAEASYNCPFLTKVKSTLWRLDLVNWGLSTFLFPSPFTDDPSLSPCVLSSQAAASHSGTAVPLLVQLWPQGLMLSGAKRLHVCKSTCRPWENHSRGNVVILAGTSREKLKYQTCLNFVFLLIALSKLWVAPGVIWPCVCSGRSYASCAVVVQDCLASVANAVQELVVVSQPCPTTTNAQNHKGRELVGVSAPSGCKDTNRHT